MTVIRHPRGFIRPGSAVPFRYNCTLQVPKLLLVSSLFCSYFVAHTKKKQKKYPKRMMILFLKLWFSTNLVVIYSRISSCFCYCLIFLKEKKLLVVVGVEGVCSSLSSRLVLLLLNEYYQMVGH